MNTVKRNYAMLPVEESKVLFVDQEIDFGFPMWQLWRIEAFWKQGDSIIRIAERIGRKPEEVALALFEMVLSGKIDDLEMRRKRTSKSTLLVPGKQILKMEEENHD